MARDLFYKVPGYRPRRSAFDLSYEKKFTADPFILYPCFVDEVVPGDTFKMGVSAVIRFNPLATPFFNEVSADFHTFFVPYRLLDKTFEKSLTGGRTGNSSVTFPKWQYPPTPPANDAQIEQYGLPCIGSVGRPILTRPSVWEYLGFPIDLTPQQLVDFLASPVAPLDYPRRAYLHIFASYYLDENLPPYAYDQLLDENMDFSLAVFDYGLNTFSGYFPPNPLTTYYGQQLYRRSYAKDYFTSALPWQQRGTQPSMPISGILPVLAPAAGLTIPSPTHTPAIRNSSTSTVPNAWAVIGNDPGDTLISHNQPGIPGSTPLGTIDLANAVTFNVSDMRALFQMQLWMERNSRSGSRYTEFLRAHFGVSPRDDRLQRPEYVGGSHISIITSEVLQTSESVPGSPQANPAGRSVGVGGSSLGTYRATEFGLMFTMLSIRSKASYTNRIDRQWIKQSRYDFFFPEFAHLSEQGIFNAELRPVGTSRDSSIFGFQGRYDELRVKHDITCGLLNPAAGDAYFGSWTMARYFPVSSPPSLNSAFLWDGVTPTKRPMAVPSQPAFIVNARLHCTAIRPIPSLSDPGLIDHG